MHPLDAARSAVIASATGLWIVLDCDDASNAELAEALSHFDAAVSSYVGCLIVQAIHETAERN